MTELMTEQEQIQQLKIWIKQYGFTILLGIVLALIITSSWRYWQNRQNKIWMRASSVYDQMITMRAQNNTAGASVPAKKLLDRNPNTPYAEMAALLLARDALIQKEDQEAIKQLNWVLDHSKNPSMREIARLRLARILINEKKADEALDMLKKVDDNNFIGLVDEVRGDAYMIKSDKKAAKKAYGLALKELPHAEVSRPILEMKFEDLATETNL